jgi:hypothetical protein
MGTTVKEPSTGKEFPAELDSHVLTGCGVRTKTVFFVSGMYLGQAAQFDF